jgi:hypothetical protein
MGVFGKTADPVLSREDIETRQELANEIAGLRAEVRALRNEKDRTQEVNDLQRQITTLQIEKDKLTEDNDRKIRETTHKVGLLKLEQEQEVANARRQTELEVREGNLAAERKTFEDQMTFRSQHFEREMGRFDSILTKLLENQAAVTASLNVERTDGPGAARTSDAS